MRGDRHRSNERASFTMMMMMMEISSVSLVRSLARFDSSFLFRLFDFIFSFELYQQRSEIQYSWCSHLIFENVKEIAISCTLYYIHFDVADEKKNARNYFITVITSNIASNIVYDECWLEIFDVKNKRKGNIENMA